MKLTKLTILLILIGLAIIAGGFVSAQTGSLLNFTGKVTNLDGTEVADGAYNFTYRLYTQPSEGTAVWTETLSTSTRFIATVDNITTLATSTRIDYSSASASSTLRVGQYLSTYLSSDAALVTDYNSTGSYLFVASSSLVINIGDEITNMPFVEGGVINENLGSVNDISGVDFSQTLYLEIEFNGEIMRPRKLLTSVPLSYDTLRFGGKTESQYATLDENEIVTGEWNFNNIVSVATSSSNTALTVAQTGSGSIVEFSSGGTTRFAVLNDGRVQIGDYYFPIAHGSPGYVLKTDLNGNMYWDEDRVGGFGTSGGDMLWASNTLETLIHPIDTGDVVVIGNIATTTFDNMIFEVQGSSLFDIVNISSQQELRFYDADNSNYMALRSTSTIDSNFVLTFPGGAGNPAEFLMTDGNGALYWGSPPSAVVYANTGLTGQMAYYENGGVVLSGTSSVYLTSQGNFAIGTTSASQLFTVGAVSGSQFLVNSSGQVVGGLWQGTEIGVTRGGTGLTASPSYGQILLGNASSGYTLTATNTLGLQTEYNNLDEIGQIVPSGYGEFIYWDGMQWSVSATSTWDTNTQLSDPEITALGYIKYLNLGMLSDVSTSSLLVNDMIYWDGSSWVTTATSTWINGLQTAYNNLDDIGAISGQSRGDMIYWNGTNYVGIATTSLGLGQGGTVLDSTLGYISYYSLAGDTVSGTSSIYIDSNRYIGIGTTTPDSIFHVDGDGTFGRICVGGTCISEWGSAGPIDSTGVVAGGITTWYDADTITASTSIQTAYGGTGKTSWNQYAIPYLTDSNTFGEIAIGSANYVLAVNPSADGYVWMNASSTGATYQFYAQYSPAQTGIIQVFATSTAGNDFQIVSFGDTHTFYLPDAGAGSRGLLTAADWTTFNNKWDDLADMTLDTGFVYVGYGNDPVATSTIFIDTTLNYVGIGTTTPDTIFHVDGTGTFSELCFNGDCRSSWTTAGAFDGGGIAGRIAVWTDADTLSSTGTVQVAYGGTGHSVWDADELVYTVDANTLNTINKGSNNTVFYIDSSGNYTWTATSSWDTDTYLVEQDITDFGFIKGLTLGNLYDVSTSSLATNDVLYWDGDSWETTGTSTWDTDTNTQLSDPEIGAFGYIKGLTLGNLWDVSTSSLATNHILYWDGDSWETSATTTWTHDMVTLAGTENYLTISGQEISVNEIDISEHTSLSVTALGLTLNDDAIELTSGYLIPRSASTTNWNNFFDLPSTVIADGDHLTWSGNQLDVDDDWWDNLDDMVLSTGYIYVGYGNIPVATSSVFIDVSQNYVGVGTTTPNTLFHVDGKGTFGELCFGDSCVSSWSSTGLQESGSTPGHPAVWVNGNTLTSTSSINVAYGGTGRQSLTDGEILLGAGSGPINTLAVANAGEIVIGDGVGGPTILAAFTAEDGYLKTQYGGIGTSSASWLGIAFVQNGVWSATSALSIAFGGTGADNASSARANLGIKGVYEYGINSPAPDGYIWMSDGDGRGAWVATSSLGITGGSGANTSVFVGTTTVIYDGHFASSSFEGYEAANYLCDYEYPGSHFCRTYDLLVTAELTDVSGWGGEGWVAEGPPGFTSDSNDCNGWTDNSSTKYGAWWEYTPNGGMGWLIYCNFSKPISCCSRQ
jgi:hypothetical protein